MGSSVEHGLVSGAVVHVEVLVAVQVYGLGRAVRRVVHEYAAYVCGMVVVARCVVGHFVVEQPLPEQAVSTRRIEACHAGHVAEDGTVVETRGDFLVGMVGWEGVGGAPLVREVTLHLVLVFPGNAGLEDQYLGHVPLQVVVSGGVLLTDLDVDDRGVGLEMGFHFRVIGYIRPRSDVEFGRSDKAGGGSGAILRFVPLGDDEGGCATRSCADDCIQVHPVVQTVEADCRSLAELLCPVGRFGGSCSDGPQAAVRLVLPFGDYGTVGDAVRFAVAVHVVGREPEDETGDGILVEEGVYGLEKL